MERIGVIGLGRMGSAIAAGFAAAGHDVIGWTRSGLSAARAAALGCDAAPDIAGLVAGSDIVILSLYDDAAAHGMLDALLTHDLSDKLVVETSTVTTEPVQSRAKAFKAAGAGLIDAPISGGPELVSAGQCGIFVGGDKGDADRFLFVAAAISDKAGHVGPLGSGVVMKVINNGMLQGYFATLADMMQIAKRAGLPMEMVLQIIAKGPAGTPMLAARLPKMIGDDTSVGFPAAGGAKDSAVFLRVAEAQGVDAATLRAAGALWQRAMDEGLAEADIARMIPHVYDRA